MLCRFLVMPLVAGTLCACLLIDTAAAEDMTGPYIGLHGGLAAGQSDWNGPSNPAPAPGFSSANTADHDLDGAAVGATAGYRFAREQWVYGVEGEFTWVDLDETTPSTAFAGFLKQTEIDWVGALTAQLGYRTGGFLPYLEAGIAFSSEEYTIIDQAGGPPPQVGDDDTRIGWLIGAGLETMVSERLSAKAEYNYRHFGEDDYTLGTERWDVDSDMHTFLIGVNLHFSLPQ